MNPNRNWPSMFIRDPSNSSAMSSDKTSCEGTASHNDEWSSRDPKPRWNPKAEQIQILEGIFNSGMVTPSREEIRNITTQLREFGEVGDANIFYWFQNRKSRTKQKQRHLQAARISKSREENSRNDQPKACPNTTTADSFCDTGESSSSTVPVATFSTGQEHHSYHLPVNLEMNIDQRSYLQALESTGATINRETGEESIYRCSVTVFINDSEVELPAGPINVKAFFGENAVLLHSSGQPVLVNPWGFTLQGLQHRAMYYLI